MKSHLNHLMITISCLAVFLLPIFVAGCGDEGEDNGTDITTPGTTTKVSFQKDVFPILQDRCALPQCHGGNPPTGGLRLTNYDELKKGGKNGPAFIPNNSKESLIVKRIDGGGMPPGGAPLNKEQIQLIKDWIDAGAEAN